MPQLNGDLTSQWLAVRSDVRIDRDLFVFLQQLTNRPIKFRLEIGYPPGEFLRRSCDCLSGFGARSGFGIVFEILHSNREHEWLVRRAPDVGISGDGLVQDHT